MTSESKLQKNERLGSVSIDIFLKEKAPAHGVSFRYFLKAINYTNLQFIKDKS
jgi:hypothetical protein